MAADTRIVLFDFAGADAAEEWQAVNDGVMGGVSQGTFQITDRKTLAFFGTTIPGEQRRLRLGAHEGEEAGPGER